MFIPLCSVFVRDYEGWASSSPVMYLRTFSLFLFMGREQKEFAAFFVLFFFFSRIGLLFIMVR